MVSRAGNLRRLKKLNYHTRSKSKTTSLLYTRIKAAKTRKKFCSISSLSQINRIGKEREGEFGKSMMRNTSKKLTNTIGNMRKLGLKENYNGDAQKKMSNFRKRRLKNYLKNLSNNRSASRKEKSKGKSILHQSNFSNMRGQGSIAGYTRGSKSPKNSSLVNSQITNVEKILKEKKGINFSNYYREVSRKASRNGEVKKYKDKYFEVKKENMLLKKTLKKAISLISCSDMKSKVTNRN